MKQINYQKNTDQNMNNILPFTYNHTKKWIELVDASIADGYSGVDRMIQAGIRQTTNMMLIAPLDSTAKKIVDLLETQAWRLQGKKSDILNHIAAIHDLIHDAETGGGVSIAKRIETLRLAGYQDDRVFPHNRDEIESLIDAKRSLNTLQQIFQFCARVKQAEETHAAPEKIKELMYKAKEFDGIENYRALNLACETLQALSTVQPVAPQPKDFRPPTDNQSRQSASYSRWFLTVIYKGASYVGSLPWKVAKAVCWKLFK